MITPQFELDQTSTMVTVTIYAPYCNVRDADVYIDCNDFRFFCPPYYLRLTFPGELQEIGASYYVYDADNGKYIISLAKVKRGQHFANIDLISTLLMPPGKEDFPKKPSIAVLNEQGEESFETDESFTYSDIDKTVPPSSDACDILTINPKHGFVLKDLPKYGFARQSSQVFRGFECEAKEMLDIVFPDSVLMSERKYLRETKETADFSDDHYLADRFETDEIDRVILFVPMWYLTTDGSEVKLNDEEVRRLKDIKVREYLLTTHEKCILFLGLVDILAAFCYDHRTTEDDMTVESAWTINKLSSTLCCFEEFHNLKEVLIAFMRRSLCYPLYRNWDLSEVIVKDVQQILRLGTRMVLKCFLRVHKIFNKSPPRYILNRLYIQDYCIWVQSISSDNFSRLADKIDEIMPNRDDLKLDIIALDFAADMVQREEVVEEEEDVEEEKLVEEEEEEITIPLEKMTLNDEESSSEEESSSTSSSSSEAEDKDEDDTEDEDKDDHEDSDGDENQEEVIDSDDLSS